MRERPPRPVILALGVLLVLSAIAMIVAGSPIFAGEPERPRGRAGALIGRPAPELGLPLVAGPGARENDRITLAPLAGRVVLLDFWASWCAPCRQSIPVLNEIHERYADRVELIGINVESAAPRGAVQTAHRAFGARFGSVQDEDDRAQIAYGVDNIPTLVLIDRAGVVRWVETGVADPDELADRLDGLLGDTR